MKKSIVFCGTPDFAIPSLQSLATDPRFDVRLVITQPDRPVGRTGRSTPPPVKKAAIDLGIEVWQPEELNAQLADGHYKAQERPDFLVVVAYGQLLSDGALAWPTVSPINVHASLLPRWRGASPIEHAILHGDTETGITIQRMVKELDAGPILGMERTRIGTRETALQLRERLAIMGATLLLKTLSQPLKETPQPRDGITTCRKLSREDGNADTATMTADHIDRMVRAFDPWPGVRIDIQNRSLKLLEVSLTSAEESMPIDCADGTTLHALRVQEPGKKQMTGVEWKRGIR